MIDGTFYELGGGGMPLLDYANPLYSFTSSEGAIDESYTATQDGYLFGSVLTYGNQNTTIKIDNTTIYFSVQAGAPVIMAKVKKNSVIRITSSYSRCDGLKFYKEL